MINPPDDTKTVYRLDSTQSSAIKNIYSNSTQKLNQLYNQDAGIKNIYAPIEDSSNISDKAKLLYQQDKTSGKLFDNTSATNSTLTKSDKKAFKSWVEQYKSVSTITTQEDLIDKYLKMANEKLVQKSATKEQTSESKMISKTNTITTTLANQVIEEGEQALGETASSAKEDIVESHRRYKYIPVTSVNDDDGSGGETPPADETPIDDGSGGETPPADETPIDDGSGGETPPADETPIDDGSGGETPPADETLTF